MRRRKAEGGRQPAGARLVPACLLLSAFCLLLSGCRQDMQDTPRHEAYEPGTDKFSERGSSSRTLPEGTVARGFLRENAYLYTGKADAGGAQQATGGMGGTATGTAGGAVLGSGSPQTQAPGGSASGTVAGAGSTLGAQQTTGTVNVRGNVAGGVPGAAEAAATGGPDVFPFPVTEAVVRRGQERYNAFCSMCHGMTGEGDGMIVRRGFRRPPSYFEDRLQENSSPASHFFDVITNGWGAMPSYDYMIPPEDRWAIIAYIRALQLSRRIRADELTPEERARVTSDAQKRPDPGAHGTQTQQKDTGQGARH
ncbi:MAG TPA: cytochrome c [Pyrinomonadaceae bacterium]|nr:cytochrome c [Pyrinomonadaceae bacterium]